MNENATASIIGLCQGSALTQPKAPRPPRSRPAISTEAVIVKIVSRVGTDTMPVNTACRNLTPEPTCGSWNRWCTPIGIENTRNSTNEMRAIVSLYSRPPIARGTSV
jgi:hypothetical protein